jgi:FlaG/FlaF family flagellin (archaellin)
VKKLLANRKAVSPVVATILIIGIAVAGALLVYVSSIGTIGGLQSGGGEQIAEQIMLDVYSWNATTGQLQLVLRNVGRTEVTIDWIYVSTDAGIENFDGATVSDSGSGIINIDGIDAFTCGVTVSNLTAGATYVIKVVTKSGGVFSYSVVAGSSF